jgi:glycosyltransferase involved in cell wall biosynthesis
MKDKLTIVIPCKNEENYIGNLLNYLKNQKDIEGVRIIISDAGSTDNTINIIKSFSNSLSIKLIKGGLPAIGRNKGLNLSKTKWTLFIDSDIVIKNSELISNLVTYADKKDLDIIGSKLSSDDFRTKLIYKLNNLLVKLSFFDKPFIVGSFCLVNTSIAKKLGGFPTNALHCEDYLFSKKFDRKKAGLFNNYIFTDNRRFKKMGYLNMIFYVLKNIKMRNNNNYFQKNINYW